jgi:hypothetical protein
MMISLAVLLPVSITWLPQAGISPEKVLRVKTKKGTLSIFSQNAGQKLGRDVSVAPWGWNSRQENWKLDKISCDTFELMYFGSGIADIYNVKSASVRFGTNGKMYLDLQVGSGPKSANVTMGFSRPRQGGERFLEYRYIEDRIFKSESYEKTFYRMTDN